MDGDTEWINLVNEQLGSRIQWLPGSDRTQWPPAQPPPPGQCRYFPEADGAAASSVDGAQDRSEAGHAEGSGRTSSQTGERENEEGGEQPGNSQALTEAEEDGGSEAQGTDSLLLNRPRICKMPCGADNVLSNPPFPPTRNLVPSMFPSLDHLAPRIIPLPLPPSTAACTAPGDPAELPLCCRIAAGEIFNPLSPLSGMAPPPFEEDSASAVGWRVGVWWPDDACFYYGVVERYDQGKAKYLVHYDDNEIEWLALTSDIIKWVSRNGESKSQATRETQRRAAAGDRPIADQLLPSLPIISLLSPSGQHQPM